MPPFTGRRILVTGASGFIGRHALAPLLARGYEVHAVSRRRPVAEAGVRWHAADLSAHLAADRLVQEVRPSHLLHFAWYTAHGEYWTSAENLHWVAASLHLLRSFAEAGGERAVFAGTCAEYDWSDGFCSENETPLLPNTLYGTAKDALRRVVEAYAAEHGVSVAWGRIFFVFGPHEHPDRLVSSVARALVAGEPAPVSHGRQVRDFLHVADAADAFATLVAGDVRGAVNVASGEPRSIAFLVNVLARDAGRPDLLRMGALSPASDDAPLIAADVQRLRDEVGWTPSRTLEERLAETLAWWRAQLASK